MSNLVFESLNESIFQSFKQKRDIKNLVQDVIDTPSKKISDIEKELKDIALDAYFTFEEIAEIRENVVINHLTEFIKSFVKDDLILSDNEYNAIKKEIIRLVPDVNDENIRALDGSLQQYRENYQIAQGKMNPIDVDINLGSNEKCYFSSDVVWNEYRKSQNKIIPYVGLVKRIPLGKGFSFRLGAILPIRMSKDKITPIDNGTIYFTNKRVIFDGNYGNKTIPLKNILGITQYENAIEIQRSSGKSPILNLNNKYRANLILSSLLQGDMTEIKSEEEKPQLPVEPQEKRDWVRPKPTLFGARFVPNTNR